MQTEDWWHRFAQSGRVEDYLRYRGVSLAGDAAGEDGEARGEQGKTASDDRGSHRTGL